jgi:hypothetical protein
MLPGHINTRLKKAAIADLEVINGVPLSVSGHGPGKRTSLAQTVHQPSIQIEI